MNYEAPKIRLIMDLRRQGITDKGVLSAVERVPREMFVPEAMRTEAYENIPLQVDCEQTISQPYVVAYMIECLKLKKTDVVLEVGTGTGYQAAVISHLCQKIYTIEIFSKLFGQAKFNIRKLKITNITNKLGNGITDCNKSNFFDAIIVSAASE